MGNPKQFLEQYEKEKKIYLENKDRKDPEGFRKQGLAEHNLNARIKGYVRALSQKKPMAVFDLYKDELMKKSPLTEKILSNFNFWVENNMVSESIRDQVKYALGNVKNDNYYEAFRYIVSYICVPEPSEEEAKAKDMLITHLESLFSDFKAENPFSGFDALIAKYPPTEETVMTEEEYLSDYEQEPLHPYHDQIERLLEKTDDPELRDALLGSDEILTDVRHRNDTRGFAEALGDNAEKSIDGEVLSYVRENGFDFYPMNTYDDAKKICDSYEKNAAYGYHPSPLFVSRYSEMIKYGREKGLFTTDKSRVHASTAYHENALKKSQDGLRGAITRGNTEDIKKYYKETQNVMSEIDYIHSGLKGVDDRHLYVANLGVARNNIYPARYKLDVEGATLYNQAALLSDICLKYDINVDQLLKDPVGELKKAYIREEKNSPLNHMFEGDVFQTAMNVGDEIRFMNTADSVEADFYRLSSILTIGNPEHRVENHYSLLSAFHLYRFANTRNLKSVTEAFTDPEKKDYMAIDVLPAIILTGKDFRPFEMLNSDDGSVDLETMKPRADFDLKGYIKTHYTTNDLFRKLDSMMKSFHKVPEGNQKVLFGDTVVATSKFVRQALQERLPGHDDLIARVIDDHIGAVPLSEDKKATMEAELAYHDMNRGRLNASRLPQTLAEIANLEKRYKSHGLFARIFYRDVRNQGSVLKELKEDLVKNGLDGKGLDDAIYSINHDHAEKAYDFMEQYNPTVKVQAAKPEDDLELEINGQKVDVKDLEDFDMKDAIAPDQERNLNK